MTETVAFTLPGAPVAKGRPRFARGVTYTDAKMRAAEQSVLAAYLVAGGSERTPHDGPVVVSIVATFVPAESWPKWKRSRAVLGAWPHTARPDIDNVVKAVFDALNGRAYTDDSQIVRLIAVKQYGPHASTAVKLRFEPVPTRSGEGAGG